jgi:HEPN domain-containing protein
MANENEDELIETLWLRVEPGIKKLMPKADQIDLLRTKVLVKRALKHIVIRRDSSSLAMADKYLAAGEADYRAANLLFQHGGLALSVYHIQQAIEKAMKAFCLSVGDVTIEELRTTHRTPQPLLKIIEERPGSEMISVLKSLGNRDYKTAVTQVKKMVNSDQKQLAKLPMKSSARVLGIELLIKVADALLTTHPLLEQKEKEVKTVFAEYLPEYKESIVTYSLVKFGQAAGQCYIFGVLTFPHESYTRYPGGFLEPRDYTQELGIVQAIPTMIERVPRTLALVRDVILICRKQISQGTQNNA